MATIEAIKRNGNIVYPLTSSRAIVDDQGNRISVLVSEPTDEIDYTTDYVLMVKDIVQELSDDENKAISPKAVKTALQDMIISIINTPI